MPFVELAGGLIVSSAALALALDLDARGHAVRPHPDASDRISVLNGSTLTAAEKAAIVAHRFHLAALCRLPSPDPAALAARTEPASTPTR